MKVAVIGASGNVGTALLRALAEEDQIEDIIGIARRVPDLTSSPYGAASWEQIDLATPILGQGEDDPVIDQLAQVLTGVDAVVHLAWMIQPNHQRDLIRRGNVEGTRRVIEACLRAGVGHLVCASSVGAYSRVDDDVARDESWPAEGIATSHYSVDKAAQERLLDDADSRGLSVARVRSALVFDADAGAEITRLFLGALIPPAMVRPGVLPVLPWPAGLRMQVVHGDDLADAYRRILIQGATGAFNIATEPVLHAPDVAKVLGRGRHISVPAGLLRPMVYMAWRAHAVAADHGWLDMAMSVPVMDTSRAQRELGWQPEHDAEATLRELLSAMADGVGTSSAPMRSRETWPQDQMPPGQVPVSALADDSSAHRVPAELERDILGLYLSDHLTGATAGVERFERMADAYADTDLGPDLADLSAQISEERQFLQDLLIGLEFRQRAHRQAVAWVGEKAARLKTNGRLESSPMTPLLEIELMRSAVVGKLGVWETLTIIAPDLGLPPDLFAALSDRVAEQTAILERLHQHVVPEAFRVGHIN